MSAARALITTGLLALLGAGCASSPSEPADGPGEPIAPADIPPAVPKAEPPSRYGNPESYVVDGQRYEVRATARGYEREGVASWYGRKFHGRRTSSGEPYDMYRMTAAHRSLPLPTYVRVTHLGNGRSAVVRVNDRGPFVDDRLIDLSYAAATRLGMIGEGTARVRVRALEPAGPQPRQAGGAADVQGESDRRGAALIQVGAFNQRDNATALRARLRAADIGPVKVEAGCDRHGQFIHRVRVGPVRGGEARRALLSELETVGVDAVRIVDDRTRE